jgi:hypothetical protein
MQRSDYKNSASEWWSVVFKPNHLHNNGVFNDVGNVPFQPLPRKVVVFKVFIDHVFISVALRGSNSRRLTTEFTRVLDIELYGKNKDVVY